MKGKEGRERERKGGRREKGKEGGERERREKREKGKEGGERERKGGRRETKETYLKPLATQHAHVHT